MTWINRDHHNTPGSPNGFGGSMCVCSKCKKERVLDNAVNHVERITQIDKTVAELKILSDMLASPYKKGKLYEAATMLNDWVRNMEVAVC